MMPGIYLVATLSGTGAVMQNIRYLHSSPQTPEEAEEACRTLNKALVSVQYRVVDE